MSTAEPSPTPGPADLVQWQSRRALAAVVRAAVMVVPIVAASAATMLTARVLPPPGEPLRLHILWWTAVILVSFGTLVAAEKVTRRFLPLAALLSLSLSFPDQVPNRFRVALRSGSPNRVKGLVSGETRLSSDVNVAVGQVLELTAALATHDRRTRGHSERVRAYADLVAQELHLPGPDREKLRWASLLHDIGKLHVPASILNKPGKPSEVEWEILRGHPAAGESFVAPLAPWLGDWIGAVGEHHERFDGLGYPNGRRGEEISVAARIVAVCDTFEVMTAARSYKKPLPASVALSELMRQSGRQFDPRMVRAFLNLSIPKLRRTIGPLALAAQLPFLSPAGVMGSVAPTTVAMAGATASGAVLVSSGVVTPTPPTQVALPAPTSSVPPPTLPPRPVAPPDPAAWAAALADVGALPLGTAVSADATAVAATINAVLGEGTVQFAVDSADIAPESTARLDRVAGLLLAKPSVRVEIAGHTDAVGDAAANLLLSERRAQAVRTYLTERGVAADRMVVVGYGESRPVDDNGTAEGRDRNRRIEFVAIA